MKSPILILESMDIGVYNSVDHVKSHLELVDVKDGIYEAYDYDGFLLDIKIQRVEIKQQLFFVNRKKETETISIQIHEPKLDCSVQVRTRLIEYLKFLKYNESEIVNLPLSKLVVIVSKYMPWKVNF